MTTGESCALLADVTIDLSTRTAERDSWRLLALASMHHAAELERELQMVDERRYVCRTHNADRLDVFLDQTDLRRQEAA